MVTSSFASPSSSSLCFSYSSRCPSPPLCPRLLRLVLFSSSSSFSFSFSSFTLSYASSSSPSPSPSPSPPSRSTPPRLVLLLVVVLLLLLLLVLLPLLLVLLLLLLVLPLRLVRLLRLLHLHVFFYRTSGFLFVSPSSSSTTFTFSSSLVLLLLLPLRSAVRLRHVVGAVVRRRSARKRTQQCRALKKDVEDALNLDVALATKRAHAANAGKAVKARSTWTAPAQRSERTRQNAAGATVVDKRMGTAMECTPSRLGEARSMLERFHPWTNAAAETTAGRTMESFLEPETSPSAYATRMSGWYASATTYAAVRGGGRFSQRGWRWCPACEIRLPCRHWPNRHVDMRAAPAAAAHDPRPESSRCQVTVPSIVDVATNLHDNVVRPLDRAGPRA